MRDQERVEEDLRTTPTYGCNWIILTEKVERDK